MISRHVIYCDHYPDGAVEAGSNARERKPATVSHEIICKFEFESWIFYDFHYEKVCDSQVRPQIALNLVFKSSNMRQIQKSTFSVKLRRIPFVFWNV